ncbi:MAG: STAS domain-containing protein [Myxococcales bacterium]|nr:STAS domain-containing protein [Myxococcales bacterium]
MALQRMTKTGVREAASVQTDVAVLRCAGEMGNLELAQIGEELFRLSRRGHQKVVLDLSRVEHLDYRSLGALSAQARLLRSMGGDLKLCGLSPYLAAIFRAAGLEEAFETYAEAEDAKRAFLSSFFCLRH